MSRNNEEVKLIIINGASATGKTALGKEIAKKLNLPLICKDDIKELLFDDLGWSDREWSKKVGGASFDLLWHTTETMLSTNISLIIETKFHPENARKKLQELKAKYRFRVIEMNCHADGDTILKRFSERAKNKRHPGHNDLQNIDLFKEELLRGKVEPIDDKSKIISIDTTDFSTIDIDEIVEKIKKL